MKRLNYVLKDDECSGDYAFETIGFSEEGRPLNAAFLGDADSPLRVFIIAGQHGDEKYGRRAAVRLIRSLGKSLDIHFPSMHLAVLPDANPDGSVGKTRANAVGIDLNRDHQRLDSKETRAIHSFVRSWRPALVIDVHNYPSKRKRLLEKNRIINYDIFIDVPTNPALRLPVDNDTLDEFLETVKSDLKLLGYSSERYAIVKPSERVRHSTPDIVDARNALSLRYGVFTVLLEGRNPTRIEGEAGRTHIVSAQFQSLLAILGWMQKHSRLFTDDGKRVPSPREQVAISSKYKRSDSPFKMTFKNSLTGDAEEAVFFNYTPGLEITKYIGLPFAYAVPSDKTEVIKILLRHGFVSQPSNPSRLESIESYVIRCLKPSKRKNRPPKKISVLIESKHEQLDGYVLFPTGQEGGHALAVFLEPESKYGLHRYGGMNLPILSDSRYPILRVL